MPKIKDATLPFNGWRVLLLLNSAIYQKLKLLVLDYVEVST